MPQRKKNEIRTIVIVVIILIMFLLIRRESHFKFRHPPFVSGSSLILRPILMTRCRVPRSKVSPTLPDSDLPFLRVSKARGLLGHQPKCESWLSESPDRTPRRPALMSGTERFNPTLWAEHTRRSEDVQILRSYYRGENVTVILSRTRPADH